MFHPDDANPLCLREGQRHADAQRKGGFDDMRAIDPKFTAGDKLRGKPARLEEAGMPKPLVDALGVAQDFLSLSPIKACANGLSGSIGFSLRGGRASKERGFCPPSGF